MFRNRCNDLHSLKFCGCFRNYAQTLPLKKVTSIFFACLVLFNALGFYGLLVGIQYQSGRALESRLDKEQYDATETVTLKFPITLPYYIDDQSYERVDGEVEHRGEFYRLVKQKRERDTLYIVCIKDHDGKRIAEALSDYVKTYTDKPADAKQILKSFSLIKDFIATVTTVQSASAGWGHDFEFAFSTALYASITATHKSPPPRG
jgi:hypothetical protein